MFSVVTANETNVGGTFMFSKVPLMESFPPIAATFNSFCALKAPNSAATGFPHFLASFFNFSKLLLL